MSSSIGKRALVTSTVIAAFVGTGLAAAPEASAATSDGSKTVTYIKNHDMGKRYSETRDHGMGPNYFDCSGLLKSAFKNGANRWLPRVANDQYKYLKGKKHTFSSKSSLRNGDLIFFHSRSGYVFHVGIYVGNKNMINANSTRGYVKTDSAFYNWGFAYENFGRI